MYSFGPGPSATGEAAVELFAPEALAPVLVLCDHASNHVPVDMAHLGLPADELKRHIAWDIGAAEVARRLARRLDATAVLSAVSRLVIDCNRPIGHPASICPTSDGTEVPGNKTISDAQAALRAERFYWPYHRAIAAQLARIEAKAGMAALIAVHSFTPALRGEVRRPWHVGILWNRDGRLAEPLIDALRRHDHLCVGDNEPYSGRLCNHTTDTHGAAHGRPHVSIEIRQDEIASREGAHRWADFLADLLAPMLSGQEGTG